MAQPALLNHGYASPLRYPGGKGALAKFLKHVVTKNDLLDGHYVEPFAGGAGIAWSMLIGEYVSHIHINDLDRSIYSFWLSVLDYTEDLCRLIHDSRVTMTAWRKQKAIQKDAAGHSALELGFSTFFLNRTNRSGIISGGVIGGKKQTGTWKLDARYNKRDLINRIQRIARYKNRISLYCKDGKDFIRLVLPKLPKRTLVYVDPPYYAKGQNLYRNLFTQGDHESLAASIQRRIHQPWIVSYDAVPPVVALYRDRRERRYYLSYSAQMRYSGQEVMFFSDDLVLPTASHPVISRRRR